MRTRHSFRHFRRSSQGGVVLVLAIIVLVAMSLAAIGLMRGVMGGNRVAGNLATQQAALQAADVGVERAIAWLEQKSRETEGEAASPKPANKLYKTIITGDTYKYSAIRGDREASQTLESYWTAQAGAELVNDLPVDASGNQVSFVIHRLCSEEGAPSAAGCDASPTSQSSQGMAMRNGPQVSGASAVYYRVTVRVQGPRNASSFIQAVISI